MNSYLYTYFSAFFYGLVLFLTLKKLAAKYNLLVSNGIPHIGGLSIGLSFLLASLLFLRSEALTQQLKGILVAAMVVLAFGVADDWRELSIAAKFIVQVIATLLLAIFGTRAQIAYIGYPLNIIITFVWILGITNAFNHLDIIDGLAAGSAVIVSLAFFVIAVLNGDITMTFLALGLSGAVSGFLVFNLPPAKAYMGNSGSHFLGFVLAAIALCISYAPLERKIALLSPIFILGLPIFDTAFLMLMRILKKSSPLKKSNDHLALRFLALGYSKKETLLIMLGLCLFYSLCGILISQLSIAFGIAIIALVFLASLLLTLKMGRVLMHG